MRISRRDFARSAGLIAGAALLPKAARSDEKAAAPKASAPATSAPTATKLSAAGQAEADARVQMILARHGARLSPAERADLARLSADAQAHLDKLRAYPLDVADEPAHVFRAPRRKR